MSLYLFMFLFNVFLSVSQSVHTTDKRERFSLCEKVLKPRRADDTNLYEHYRLDKTISRVKMAVRSRPGFVCICVNNTPLKTCALLNNYHNFFMILCWYMSATYFRSEYEVRHFRYKTRLIKFLCKMPVIS